MPNDKTMKSFAFLPILAVAAALFVGGCGKSDNTPVSAREKRVMPPAPSKADVTRWKEAEAREGSYGIVVEQDGNKVSANLYKLQAGDGLVIRERESQGKFMPEEKVIVFPLYNPPTISAEIWVKDGGPHIVVPWDGQASKLTGTLKQPGQSNSYNFVKLEGVAPTYPTGAGAR